MSNLQRSVGYVQIAFGVMLIFACLIGYDLLSARAERLFDSTDSTLEKVFYNTGATQTEEELSTILRIRAYSDIITELIIQSFIVIIFILAVMIILQGVANTRFVSDEEIPPGELGKFMTALLIIIFIIAALYVIIFKSFGSEKLTKTLYLVIMLAVLLLIARFINRDKRKVTKKKE